MPDTMFRLVNNAILFGLLFGTPLAILWQAIKACL